MEPNNKMQIASNTSSSKGAASHFIDTFSMPSNQSREVWQEIVQGTFELEGAHGSEKGHRVSTNVWFVDDLLVAGFKGEANIVHRTRSLIDRNPTPFVKVRLYRSGSSILIGGDDQKVIGPGAIHFIDHDRPLRQVSGDHEQLTIGVPYHLIGFDPSVHPAVSSVELNSPRGRLLQSAFQTVFDEVETTTHNEAPAFALAFAGLLRGILAGGADSESTDVSNARMAAMKRYIDQHLDDPELSVESLTKLFGASRATIYRNFAEDGGINSYIRERRLQRAFRLLSEAIPGRGHIQKVAMQCGFLSLAHFSRSFRERHHVTPSEVLGQWRTSGIQVRNTEGEAAVKCRTATPDWRALRWAYQRFR